MSHFKLPLGMCCGAGGCRSYTVACRAAVGHLAQMKHKKDPDPPILAFFDFLAFFRFPISLAFLCVFPFFSKDFRGSAKRKTLAFFGGFPCFFQESKGWRVRGGGFLEPLHSMLPPG